MTLVLKKLLIPTKYRAGRRGRILHFRKGGRNKRLYRCIDFLRLVDDLIAVVVNITYDPFRSSPIALICYINGLFSYILASVKLNIGAIIFDTSWPVRSPSGFYSVKELSPGQIVHNIEIRPFFGAQLVRSAGEYGVVSSLSGNTGIIKLPSGCYYTVNLNSRACVGVLGMRKINLSSLKKAGLNRKLGKKPKVRGIARNPVDHPNGGRTHGGKVFKSMSGQLKGVPTRRNRVYKVNKYISLL